MTGVLMGGGGEGGGGNPTMNPILVINIRRGQLVFNIPLLYSVYP